MLKMEGVGYSSDDDEIYQVRFTLLDSVRLQDWPNNGVNQYLTGLNQLIEEEDFYLHDIRHRPEEIKNVVVGLKQTAGTIVGPTREKYRLISRGVRRYFDLANGLAFIKNNRRGSPYHDSAEPFTVAKGIARKDAQRPLSMNARVPYPSINLLNELFKNEYFIRDVVFGEESTLDSDCSIGYVTAETQDRYALGVTTPPLLGHLNELAENVVIFDRMWYRVKIKSYGKNGVIKVRLVANSLSAVRREAWQEQRRRTYRSRSVGSLRL